MDWMVRTYATRGIKLCFSPVLLLSTTQGKTSCTIEKANQRVALVLHKGFAPKTLLTTRHSRTVIFVSFSHSQLRVNNCYCSLWKHEPRRRTTVPLALNFHPFREWGDSREPTRQALSASVGSIWTIWLQTQFRPMAANNRWDNDK